MIILGCDPGARATGICVVKDARRILAHTTVTNPGTGNDYFPASTDYLRRAVETVLTLAAEHAADLIAVETLTRPSWHLDGRAAADPRALLATAQVLGAVQAVPWPVTTVRPGKHGSAPLGVYPAELVGDGERRERGWQLRPGRGKLRHERSARDIANAAALTHRQRAAAP